MLPFQYKNSPSFVSVRFLCCRTNFQPVNCPFNAPNTARTIETRPDSLLLTMLVRLNWRQGEWKCWPTVLVLCNCVLKTCPSCFAWWPLLLGKKKAQGWEGLLQACRPGGRGRHNKQNPTIIEQIHLASLALSLSLSIALSVCFLSSILRPRWALDGSHLGKSSEGKVAPSKCKVIKWGTSSFGAAIMLRNPMQERGREMGVGFKKKKKIQRGSWEREGEWTDDKSVEKIKKRHFGEPEVRGGC